MKASGMSRSSSATSDGARTRAPRRTGVLSVVPDGVAVLDARVCVSSERAEPIWWPAIHGNDVMGFCVVLLTSYAGGARPPASKRGGTYCFHPAVLPSPQTGTCSTTVEHAPIE